MAYSDIKDTTYGMDNVKLSFSTWQRNLCSVVQYCTGLHVLYVCVQFFCTSTVRFLRIEYYGGLLIHSITECKKTTAAPDGAAVLGRKVRENLQFTLTTSSFISQRAPKDSPIDEKNLLSQDSCLPYESVARSGP